MDRVPLLKNLDAAFRIHPVVALLGPRQCGKTTLARAYAARKKRFSPENYFDLEDPTDLVRLENPKLALESLKNLIVIDEIQKRPELFPILRVLCDKPRSNQRFLILGSASRDLIHQSSETLAGRIHHTEITPFSTAETHNIPRTWVRGGFPRSYLAKTHAQSYQWRNNYIATYLERDVPQLGFNIPTESLRRFWMMLAHYHGNIFNASELGRSLGTSDTTVRRYLDILVGTFMVRSLTPWFENIGKRQVKAPKIYFRDSGILHNLLGITDQPSLLVHPKLGASWEGFALEEVIRTQKATPEECYFWAIHEQADLDLLIVRNGKRIGYEIKYTDTPRITRSMHQALELLQLHELVVIYPGDKSFPLATKIRAVALHEFVR